MSELSSYGLHPALLDPFSGRLATGVTERYFYSLAALALISPGFPLFVVPPLFGFLFVMSEFQTIRKVLFVFCEFT